MSVFNTVLLYIINGYTCYVWSLGTRNSYYRIDNTLMLQSFLGHRSQYVVLDNQRHSTEVLSGTPQLPQGTVLAPLLFYYISDLPACA